MKKIVAVLKAKKMRTRWGFIFDTEDQSIVENFMLLIHVGNREYALYFEDEAPEGVYTEVKILVQDNGYNKYQLMYT